MGPGGGDRAQGRLFRSEDEIKREEESSSPSELTPLPGIEVPGCGAGQQGAQRSDASGSGWPRRGPCGCPRRSPATLCVPWGWRRTWTFTGESRGAPSWLAGAGRGWGPCSSGTGPGGRSGRRGGCWRGAVSTAEPVELLQPQERERVQVPAGALAPAPGSRLWPQARGPGFQL